jgi:hypothetical protein
MQSISSLNHNLALLVININSTNNTDIGRATLSREWHFILNVQSSQYDDCDVIDYWYNILHCMTATGLMAFLGG